MGDILSTTKAEAHDNTANARLVGGDDPESASVAGQGAAHELATGAQNAVEQVNAPQASHNLFQGAAEAANLPETANNAAGNLAQGATDTAVNSDAAQDVAGGIANLGTGAGVGAAAAGAGAVGMGGGALLEGAGNMQRQQAEGRGLEEEHRANAARTHVAAQEQQQQLNQEEVAAVPELLSDEDRAAQRITERGIQALRIKLANLETGQYVKVYIAAITCGDIALQTSAREKLGVFAAEANNTYGHSAVQIIGRTGAYHDIDAVFKEVIPVHRVPRVFATNPSEVARETFWYHEKLEYTKLYIRKTLGFRRQDPPLLDIPHDYDWDTVHTEAHVVILVLKTPHCEGGPPYLLLPDQPIIPSILCREEPIESGVHGQIKYSGPSLHIIGLEQASKPQVVFEGVYLGSSPQDRSRYLVMHGPGRGDAGKLLRLGSDFYRYAKDPRRWFHKGVAGFFSGSGCMAIWDLNDCFEGIGFRRDGKIYTTPFERGREIIYDTVAAAASRA